MTYQGSLGLKGFQKPLKCTFAISVRVAVRLILPSLLGCAIFSSTVLGSVSIVKMDEHIAFHIDDRLFTYQGYMQFHGLAFQQANKPQGQFDKGLIKGVIENHLLALAADDEAHAGENEHSDDHSAGHSAGHSDEHSKAHDHTLGLYSETYSEYRELLSLLSVTKPPFKAEQVMVPLGDRNNLTESIERLLGSGQTIHDEHHEGAVNRIQVRGEFSDEYIALAKKTVVGRYQLPGEAVTPVFYWDVYLAQSIKNRSKVGRGDVGSIKQGVHDLVDLKLLEQYVKKSKALTDQDLSTLWQIVWDKQYKQQYYLETGIVMDLHHDQPLLNRFKRTVTDADIEKYYLEHRADFIQVGSVVARHITVATQTKADFVYEKLRSGMSFDKAVERYSLSKDGGSLGFINKNDKNLSFVKKLALIQAVGRVSTPYRMLDGKSYEIILVDKKEPEPLPLSDKSVRNQITNTLAVRKAKSDLQQSFSRWFNKHDIVLNSRYFKNVDGVFSYPVEAK